MTLVYSLLLLPALVPALVVALVGMRWFRAPDSAPEARPISFLLSVQSILLGSILLVTRPPSLQASALALIPPLMGAFAMLLLVIAHDPVQLLKFGPSEWALLLIALGLLVAVDLLSSPLVMIRLLIVSVVLAMSLRLQTAHGGWVILAGCLALALVIWEIGVFLAYGGSASILSGFDAILPFVQPLSGIAVCVVAGLVAAGLSVGRAPALTAAAFALSAAILFVSGVQIYLFSTLDMAADNIRGLAAMLLICIPGIAAGVPLSWLLTDRRRVAALLFALVVPLSAFLAMDGGYQAGPQRVTAQLASWVNQAIVRYHADHQSYPRALSDLAPWYLIVVPQPMSVSGLPWCYESGADYYRLGYSFLNATDLSVVGSAGVPPGAPGDCKPRP